MGISCVPKTDRPRILVELVCGHSSTDSQAADLRIVQQRSEDWYEMPVSREGPVLLMKVNVTR